MILLKRFWGQYIMKGKGFHKTDKEAFKWWKLAADQGHADARCSLGEMYYKGDRGFQKTMRKLSSCGNLLQSMDMKEHNTT